MRTQRRLYLDYVQTSTEDDVLFPRNITIDVSLERATREPPKDNFWCHSVMVDERVWWSDEVYVVVIRYNTVTPDYSIFGDWYVPYVTDNIDEALEYKRLIEFDREIETLADTSLSTLTRKLLHERKGMMPELPYHHDRSKTFDHVEIAPLSVFNE